MRFAIDSTPRKKHQTILPPSQCLITQLILGRQAAQHIRQQLIIIGRLGIRESRSTEDVERAGTGGVRPGAEEDAGGERGVGGIKVGVGGGGRERYLRGGEVGFEFPGGGGFGYAVDGAGGGHACGGPVEPDRWWIDLR